MVYAAGSLSLAVLEFLVHVDPANAPEVVQVKLEVPDDAPAEAMRAADLPRDWKTYPGPIALRDLGTAWAARGKSLVLTVPSAITEEEIALINPRHPTFGAIDTRILPFSIDPRLLGP